MAKARLELGNTSNIKWFEGIGEYKIDWGPGYRIYLAQDGKSLIVLFGGGTKKKQQADIIERKSYSKNIRFERKGGDIYKRGQIFQNDKRFNPSCLIFIHHILQKIMVKPMTKKTRRVIC